MMTDMAHTHAEDGEDIDRTARPRPRRRRRRREAPGGVDEAALLGLRPEEPSTPITSGGEAWT
jgi:hypothetical protein